MRIENLGNDWKLIVAERNRWEIIFDVMATISERLIQRFQYLSGAGFTSPMYSGAILRYSSNMSLIVPVEEKPVFDGQKFIERSSQALELDREPQSYDSMNTWQLAQMRTPNALAAIRDHVIINGPTVNEVS